MCRSLLVAGVLVFGAVGMLTAGEAPPVKPIAEIAKKPKISKPVPPSVAVVGLRVMARNPKQKMRSYTFSPVGVTVSVRIHSPGKIMINVDHAASKLLAFTDDQGTDLSKQNATKFSTSWLSYTTKILTSKDAALLDIYSNVQPAKGASNLTVKGFAIINCGADLKTVEQKELKLEVGGKITVGPTPMMIKTIQTPKWGRAKQRITFTSKKSLDAIMKLVFLDAEGKVIKHQTISSSSWGVIGQKMYFTDFGLMKKMDKVSLKITYYEKMESLKVPFDLKVSVGL